MNISYLKDKNKSRLNFLGEQLLSKEVKVSNDNLFGLWNLWTAYDRLAFSYLPDMIISEDNLNVSTRNTSTGYIETSKANVIFNNLKESLGQLTRIIIYYEDGDLNNIPENLDIDIIQRKKIFADISIISETTGLELEYNIDIINKPIHYYNFYAVYLNTQGLPAKINNTPVISYAINIPFSGEEPLNKIFGCPDLSIEELTVEDKDFKSFASAVLVDSNTITLSWANLLDIKENIAVYDTYGDKYTLTPNHLMKLDYYYLYVFESYEGDNPQRLYPNSVEPDSSWNPLIKDDNGTWKYYKRTKDTSLTFNLSDNISYAFWIGFGLKQ